MQVPKPPHGWRELWWDVAVVVVGVLIALAAQQVADELNWSAKLRAQRQSLDKDIAEGIGSVLLRRKWQHCVDRRFAEFGMMFERHATGHPMSVLGRPGLPYTAWSNVPSYDTAVDDGTLAHMPLAQRRYYDNVVENIRSIFDLERQEYGVWLRLQRLDHPELMTESDWADMRGAVGEARALDERVRENVPVVAGLLRRGSKPLDESAQLQDEQWGDALCKPLLAPPE